MIIRDVKILGLNSYTSELKRGESVSLHPYRIPLGLFKVSNVHCAKFKKDLLSIIFYITSDNKHGKNQLKGFFLVFTCLEAN